MGLFDFFRKREEATEDVAKEQNNETPADLLLKSLLRGEQLTKDKALSIPAISSAVDRLSNAIAMLPIKLYKYETKENEYGKRKVKVVEVFDDIRTKILNHETGDTLDPFQLKKAIVKDYLTDKGSYIYIEKQFNDFVSLRYVNPDNVSFARNFDPIFRDAKYLINGKSYETYNFLTILRNTQDGTEGKSAVDEISSSIETAFTTILYELGLVKKGGGKKGFLTATKKLGKDEIKALKDAWGKYYGNGSNEDNVIILNEGLEFKEGANSSVELQMNERKKTLKDDIKDVFHISDDYDTTIKDGVIPIISAIEHALNKNFLLDKEKGIYYFAFDTKKITRGSLKERYETYKIASEIGLMTKNEIRASEDYEAIEGLDVVSLNLANVLYDIKTGKYYTPNTGSVMNMSNGTGGDKNESGS